MEFATLQEMIAFYRKDAREHMERLLAGREQLAWPVSKEKADQNKREYKIRLAVAQEESYVVGLLTFYEAHPEAADQVEESLFKLLHLFTTASSNESDQLTREAIEAEAAVYIGAFRRFQLLPRPQASVQSEEPSRSS